MRAPPFIATAAGRSAQLRIQLLALFVLLAVGGSATPAASQPTSLSLPAFASTHVLVGFEPGTPQTLERTTEASVGARERAVVGAGTHLLTVAPGRVLSTVKALKERAVVRYAEPDWMLAADSIPNDPGFANQWGLYNTGQTIDVDENTSITGTPGADVKAPPAWDVATGSSTIVVGVVDTGIDYNHVDLAPNIWADPAPFDFHYTYTDSSGAHSDTICPVGSHGWDAIRHVCDPYDPANPGTHGTRTAGIIGARGNNGLGMAGVNWNARIIGLRWDQNSCLCGYTTQAIEAIDYAVQAKQAWDTSGGTQGANIRVLSNSWGCCYPVTTSTGELPYDPALLDEVRKGGQADILFVASAGNKSRSIDPPNYQNAHYLCDFDNAKMFGSYNATTGTFTPDTSEQALGPATNVVCVAASNYNDQLASFSNYGPQTVQIAAPGTSIYATTPGNTYGFAGGTSSATPFVSGAAALILAQHPEWGVLALKHRLVGSYSEEGTAYTGCQCGFSGGGAVDQLSSLAGRLSTGGGRLNLCKALDGCLPGAPTMSSATVVTKGRQTSILVSWSAPTTGGAPTGYRIYRGTSSGAETFLATVGKTTSYKDTAVTRGTTYYYKVSAVNYGGEGSLSPNEVSATMPQ